jgi:hypothetical protein
LAIAYLKEYEYKLKEDEAKSKLEEETKEEK